MVFQPHFTFRPTAVSWGGGFAVDLQFSVGGGGFPSPTGSFTVTVRTAEGNNVIAPFLFSQSINVGFSLIEYLAAGGKVIDNKITVIITNTANSEFAGDPVWTLVAVVTPNNPNTDPPSPANTVRPGLIFNVTLEIDRANDFAPAWS